MGTEKGGSKDLKEPLLLQSQGSRRQRETRKALSLDKDQTMISEPKLYKQNQEGRE